MYQNENENEKKNKKKEYPYKTISIKRFLIEKLNHII